MRILIYGAGVIGSIFAGKLSSAGFDTTVLARVNRFSELKENGLVLKHAKSQKNEIYKVKLTQQLLPQDIYDYIIIAMQKTQVDEILQTIANNKSPNIVFVVNNAEGYDRWADAVGADRLIIGFPSAGGERDKGTVNYFIGKGIIRSFQTTTFGEYSGKMTPRLKTLIKAFNDSGIPSVSCNKMNAWQKTHVAMVTSIANILYKYKGNNYMLSKSSSDVKLMIQGVKEGFDVIKALGYPVTPIKLDFFLLPTTLLAIVFKQVMGTKLAEITMAKHTIAAKSEMLCLQSEFDLLIKKSGLKTPAIDELRCYLNL